MKMMKTTVRAIVHSETAGLLAQKFTEYLNKRCSVVLHSIPPATLTKAGSTRQHPYLRNDKYSKREIICLKLEEEKIICLQQIYI